jgi:hypothetical protein
MFRQKTETFSVDEIRTLLRGASSTSHAASDFEGASSTSHAASDFEVFF